MAALEESVPASESVPAPSSSSSSSSSSSKDDLAAPKHQPKVPKKKKKSKRAPPPPSSAPPDANDKVTAKDLGRLLCLVTSLRIQITDHYMSEYQHYRNKDARIRELLGGVLDSGDQQQHEKLSKIVEKGVKLFEEDPNLIMDLKQVNELEIELERLILEGSDSWTEVSEMEEKIYYIMEINDLEKQLKKTDRQIDDLRAEEEELSGRSPGSSKKTSAAELTFETYEDIGEFETLE